MSMNIINFRGGLGGVFSSDIYEEWGMKRNSLWFGKIY